MSLNNNIKMKQKGLTLIELMIVLSLLVILLSAGYLLFSFGYNTFFIAQGRSDVQQNVRIVSDFLTREVRNSTSVTLFDSSVTVPAHTALNDDEHYIFLNSDGKIEFRSNEGTFLVPQGISDRIAFDAAFSVSVSNNRIVTYQIIGTRDSGQTDTLISEIFIENLAFQNRSITTVGTDLIGIYYIKEPAASLVAMTVDPYRIEENLYIEKDFVLTLTLINDTFKDGVASLDVSLGDDLTGLNVGSMTKISDNSATLVIRGKLELIAGVGAVRVDANGLTGGKSLEGKVIVQKPVGYLSARPSEVISNPGGEMDYVFELEVVSNTLKRDIDTDDVTLDGDFLTSNMTVVSASRVSATLATVTIRGNLEMVVPDGGGYGAAFITLGGDTEGDVFTAGYGLTAPVVVLPEDFDLARTLNVSTVGNGTTSITGTTSYPNNTTVTITATATGDWEFLKWTVNGSEVAHLNGEISILMNENKTAVSHFRLPYDKIPLGSYVRYSNKEYIKLTQARLMDRYPSSGTMKWDVNAAWPTRAELMGISQAARAGAGNYWTGTSGSGNDAYYVDNNGAILLRNKAPGVNQRPCISIVPSGLYAYSGDGTAANPYVVY